MINVDFEQLNPLERTIHDTLSRESAGRPTIKITEAAQICGCSVSKISKFVKKLGFANYKQYVDFLYGRQPSTEKSGAELARLQSFLEGFDSAKVDDLAHLIGQHDKLVLLGYGPSFLCAQYFEYRFKTCTNIAAIAVPDELSVLSMADEKTLVLVLTVTGTFKSFGDLYRGAKMKGSDVAIVVEEYNPSMIDQCDRLFFLSKEPQAHGLAPYEKNRTVFFIFLEEVINALMQSQSTN